MRKPTGSRFLVVRQWKKVVREAIPRLESPASAELLEAEIYRARSGGMISDSEYMEYKNQIVQVYQNNNWGNPTF